jgi:hypothetical protein
MSNADGAPDEPTADPTAYGQPISADRQAELQGMLDTWNAPGADHGHAAARLMPWH